MLRAEYKVKDGKLIKIQLRMKGDKIDAIKITGDFFMHPEELIDELEKILIGCPLEEKKITEVMKNFIENRKIILLGAAPEDFAKCIMKAGGKNG